MAGLYEGQHDTLPQTIPFQGNNTYLLNDLITFDRPFFVGCIDKPRRTIQKKNIPEDQYWFATYSKRADTWSQALPENKKAKILISEDWVHNNLPKLTGDQNDYKYKPLPPLLELSDSEKFRDEMGNVYEVEVRGEKTKHGIRFKWTDISRFFEMETNNLRYTLDETEYDTFCSAIPIHSIGNKRGNPTSTYLTYNGLFRIIFASRSGVAYRFQDWATNIIYAAHLGTTDERIDVAANDIIGTNADLVKKVLRTCITEMPCVYLFEVGKLSEMAKAYPQLKRTDMRGSVYKYGRTNSLYTRTEKHIGDYGAMTNTRLKLNLFSPVDVKDCVPAENILKDRFRDRHIEFNAEGHNYTELVVINREDMSSVKHLYKQIYTKFSSEVKSLLERVHDAELINEGLKREVTMLNNQVEDLKKEREYMRADAEKRIADAEKRAEKRIRYRSREKQIVIDRLEEEHRHELAEMMTRLSVSDQERKRCQDALCEIALLTPAQREELAGLFAATRLNLDPFLSTD